MNQEKVLALIDASPTGEVLATHFYEGLHVQAAQKPVTNLLADMRRKEVIKMGRDADGKTVYSRMTDTERADIAERKAAKQARRDELAAEKAARNGGA